MARQRHCDQHGEEVLTMTSRLVGSGCVKATATTALLLLFAVFICVVTARSAAYGGSPGSGSGSCLPGQGTCSVGVGDPGSPGNRGGGGDQGGRTSHASSGPKDNACHNSDPAQGCDPCPPGGAAADPAACSAYLHNLFCSQLNPTGVDPAVWQAELQQSGCTANPYTPVNPVVLAQQALATIRFPHPSGDRSPRQTLTYQGYPFSYVNLWTFFWTDPGAWHPLSATASAGGVSATMTARPVELVFDPGDGNAAVACAGPGRPWTASDGNSPPSDGACGYRYTKVTSGPITSTQTIVWQITWVGTGNTSGEIPSLSTSTSGQLQVLQIQVVTR